MYYFETPVGKSRWYAKQGACKTDAFLQENECKRRGWTHHDDLQSIHDQITDLSEWKQSAMTQLKEWTAVWVALGKPGALGASIYIGALAEVERLTKEASTANKIAIGGEMRVQKLERASRELVGALKVLHHRSTIFVKEQHKISSDVYKISIRKRLLEAQAASEKILAKHEAAQTGGKVKP